MKMNILGRMKMNLKSVQKTHKTIRNHHGASKRKNVGNQRKVRNKKALN